MSFSSAEQRCQMNGKQQCDDRRTRPWVAGVCAKGFTRDIYYQWSTASCFLQVKVDPSGDIAIVHDPAADYANKKNIPNSVNETTKNFFKADWDGGVFPLVSDNCGSLASCLVVDGACLCNTVIVEEVGYASTPAKDSVLSLSNGAYHPDAFDDGTYAIINCGIPEVVVYSKSGDCDNLDMDAIFYVEDDNGVDRYIKNMKSTVQVHGYSFRNPVHFHSLHDPEVRDSYYETDAVLDDYFYHPTHPPFLAIRLIQRFGISNPSPRYIKTVAEAYKKGSYKSDLDRSVFGSDTYGDLGAMIAAILLDPEAHSASLDADPAHGSLREPILKVTSFLRAMGYKNDSPLAWPLLSDLQETIGQGSHEAPSVFSFFLPEFIPPGPVGNAELTSPEAQVLGGSRITNLLDGLFTTSKYGIVPCRGGLANVVPGRMGCNGGGDADGDFSKSFGYLTYSPSGTTVDDVIDELALLLTASRLSDDNKAIIKAAILDEFPTDPAKAIRVAQQLVASTAEFHSTNLVRRSGLARDIPEEKPTSEEPYKAVVYLMFEGGADSWNLLVPKGNCESVGKDLYAEYLAARGDHALTDDELLEIDATGSNQPCDTFAVNKAIPFLQEQYQEGNALFFANTGVLQHSSVTKANYADEMKTRLFAHNHQQRETYKLDLDREAGETGVIGRIFDVLKNQGHGASMQSLGESALLVTGSPVYGNRAKELTSRSPREFNQFPTSDKMEAAILELNDATAINSGLFGETWSSRLHQALHDHKEIISIHNNDTLKVEGFKEETRLDSNFRAVAEWIKSRDLRNVNRDAFFIRFGSFDHHRPSFTNNYETKMAEVNQALTSFKSEMIVQGLWDSVVIVTGSDFGRTLTPNSSGGSDHGWGANYFMVGGSVAGKKILGNYPDDLTDDGPQVLKRGRVIPTTPWDACWNGVAQWLGVTDDEELDYCLPNRESFDQCDLFTDTDLFVDGKVPHVTDCVAQDWDGDGVPDTDDDEDGVTDDKDLCIGTPSQDEVNEHGCSVDVIECGEKGFIQSTTTVTTPGPLFAVEMDYVVSTGCEEWTEIFLEGFENGFNGIFHNSGLESRLTGTKRFKSHSGSTSLQLRGNSATSVSFTDDIDVSSFSRLKIEFFFLSIKYKNRDDFFLEYSTDSGIAWNVMTTWTKGVDWRSNGKKVWHEVHTQGFDVSNGIDSVRLRFRGNATGKRRKIFLDDIKLIGK
jgi:uncharacterized protein (DUF1501 family)